MQQSDTLRCPCCQVISLRHPGLWNLLCVCTKGPKKCVFWSNLIFYDKCLKPWGRIEKRDVSAVKFKVTLCKETSDWLHSLLKKCFLWISSCRGNLRSFTHKRCGAHKKQFVHADLIYKCHNVHTFFWWKVRVILNTDFCGVQEIFVCVSENTLVLYLNRNRQIFLCTLKSILVERVVYIKILAHLRIPPCALIHSETVLIQNTSPVFGGKYPVFDPFNHPRKLFNFPQTCSEEQRHQHDNIAAMLLGLTHLD